LDRRSFLGAIGAAGLTTASAPLRRSFAATAAGPSGRVNRVAVIGAGIVGASIAYNLSKRGCEVLLIDKRGPAAQASGNSFAWINATYFDMPPSYYWLRVYSQNEYHRLSREVDFPLHWGGSLEWYHSADREKEVADGVRRIQQLGDPTWMVDASRVAGIEPNLNLNGDWQVAYCSSDGAVDPGATTRALVEKVTAHGGETIFPARVTGIGQHSGKMRIETDITPFEVDLAVVAAGASANEIASMIDLGTDLVKPATPGIIVTTRPMERILNAISYTTDTHFHQLPDGRVILGEKAGPPGTEQHLAYLADRPNAYPSADLAAQHATRVIGTASRYVPQILDAEVEKVGVGWRPLPLDGLPVVGHVPDMPGIYLASMHSGVTLAPIIGHLAAMEILDGARVDLLSDFRVERFLKIRKTGAQGPGLHLRRLRVA
jgi:glycine/D-amino acid oxidase-like deaminating enzyme